MLSGHHRNYDLTLHVSAAIEDNKDIYFIFVCVVVHMFSIKCLCHGPLHSDGSYEALMKVDT